MFVFKGLEVPVMWVQRKFIYFAGRKAVVRSHSWSCNRKKETDILEHEKRRNCQFL